ncbi:MAG: helix-turn-helix transcriptional regulator [Actinophytocola sp.]|uniref:helix-turn-helix domain-containing protein n=1 Tax=Actinophytocola sp. TaxID=1872138 RepID=UPI003C736816
MDPTSGIWRTEAVSAAVASGDLGAIVRALRVANHLTLAQLAQLCDYSTATLSRMERGKQPLTNVRVLRLLAEALQIPPQVLGLVDTPPPAGQRRRSTARVSVIQMPDEESDPMRRRALLAGLTGLAGTSILGVPFALSTRPSDPVRALEDALLAPLTGAGVPVDPQRLRQAVAHVRATFYAGRYAEAAVQLLDLLPIAAATHATSVAHGQAAVKGQLAELHIITSELMIKVSNDPLAWTTADRATQAAQDSGDTLTQAAAARQWAIVLRRAGHASTAQRLVLDTAAGMQPDLRRGPDFFAAYGSLLSTAAYTAAVDGDRHTAHALIGEAADAARQVGTDPATRFAAFDTNGVGVYRISIARVLGDYGTAIDAARHVDPNTIPLAEQRARYWSNIARSFHEWGKPEKCYRALLAAEHAAPDEVRYRAPIQQITASLLHHPTPQALPGLHAFARRIGTSA